MLFKKLFSKENNCKKGRTVITLFGIKFNYVNKKLVIRPDYNFALSKIRNKYKNNKKIRIGFLVNENCKWNAENLYNLLEENSYFEPVILVSLHNSRHKKKAMTKASLEENYNFFAKTNKRILKVYDEKNEKYFDLKDFDIDILFYQQPWGLDDTQFIETVSANTLCCYYAYGISVLDFVGEVKPFHEKLFAYFIPNEETRAILKKHEINNLDNLITIGYPKLDIYNNLERNQTNKKTIIYAPHHSYSVGLKIGTFHKTGEQILEFAKLHQEYNWIFKPHPDLKAILYSDRNFGQQFTDEYYAEWAKIGKIYEKGNYFEQFMSSDILITDCDSFLLEYMPTMNPIIRLERKDSIKFSPLGKEIVKGVYRVQRFEEMCDCLSQLKNKNGDVLFKKRLELTETILRKEKNASANIVKELEKILINNEVINEK